ncbi:MAG: UvrB/UvrC motif-containing protein, partial [Actinomycetota bacterium]|nr:UvrB/UvrC motif-containing protein [Actinomycetota bacterium]
GRMERLAARERFEEAALIRDRLQALVPALARSRQERWLIEAGRLEMQIDGRRVSFRAGALEHRGDERGFSLPLPIEGADEVRAALSSLAASAIRVVATERAPAEPVDGGSALHRLRRRLFPTGTTAG